MDKKIYVTKYDYIYWYTKQHPFLFHTNQEIIDSINAHIKASKLHLVDDEDEEGSVELDTLEFYKEIKAEGTILDQADAKIIEGNILDQQSKQHIINTYSHISQIYDFDEHVETHRETAYAKTLSLLNEHSIIIFQPTFINGNLITRCDALVKEGAHVRIIETKGTSTVKLHHFLDLFYQSKVLEQEPLMHLQFDYYLCVVDYILAPKGACPFAITPYMNYAKAVSFPKECTKKMKREIKQGANIVLTSERTYEACPLRLTNIIQGDMSDFLTKYETSHSTGTKKAVNNAMALIEKVMGEFDEVAHTLYQDKVAFHSKTNQDKDFIQHIQPSYNDNGDFKKSDYWMLLKTFYQSQGYEIFNYSGNVVHQTASWLAKYQKGDDIKEYFKTANLIDLFFGDERPYVINRELTERYLNDLKAKKVYFDFETINIACRVIDNTYPFMQILTQCSVIISDGTIPYPELTCNNIVIDPLQINVEAFKKIVDALYMGEEYSYVVYNKSFESSRLKEMIEYINEPEYTKKIMVILNNIYDLADFFHIKAEGIPILIKEFGGFYSIKKVLPYIEKNYFHLFDATGCKDYKKLAVHNGLECQNKTTLRFFNALTSQEWEELYRNISIYCENDVRAMIAVELFVKEISLFNKK